MHALTISAPVPGAFRQRLRRRRGHATSAQAASADSPEPAAALKLDAQASRRAALAGLGALAASSFADRAQAVQGLVPGRIPGLSKPDADGFRLYTRPEGKSGGHGVGWSEIAQYRFVVPPSWDEIPVSIADPGGAELDLRFQSADEGDVAVLVAPVLRFRDVGFNADVKLEDLLEPAALIKGFGPEIIGKPVEDDDIVEINKVKKEGRMYYEYELTTKHLLVSATAFKNRLFILYAYSSPRQWRKARASGSGSGRRCRGQVAGSQGQDGMRKIQKSFYVQTA